VHSLYTVVGLGSADGLGLGAADGLGLGAGFRRCSDRFSRANNATRTRGAARTRSSSLMNWSFHSRKRRRRRFFVLTITLHLYMPYCMYLQPTPDHTIDHNLKNHRDTVQ